MHIYIVMRTSTDSSAVCLGNVLQKKPRQSGSSKIYARILVRSRTQFSTELTHTFTHWVQLEFAEMWFQSWTVLSQHCKTSVFLLIFANDMMHSFSIISLYLNEIYM